MSFFRSRLVRAAVFPLVLAPLLACEDEADPAGPNVNGELPALDAVLTAGPIDASSVVAFTHFNLSTGQVVDAGGDWDVAFRRYEVRMNGGISGSKGVTGFALENNAGATDDDVLAFTVQNTLAAFDAIRGADIPTDGAFSPDRLVANATGYINFAGVPAANAAAYWKVRTANGGYASMRVTAIAMSPSFALTSVTIQSRLHTGGALGSAQTVTVPLSGAPVAVSLVTNAVVAADGCNWDVQITPESFGIGVNTACSVGTFPGPPTPAFADATSAADAPEYGAFLAGMSGPVPNSVEHEGAPFRYNLQNDNRLTPTFNIYLVKTGAYVYKFQVINYYSAAGAGGYPTIRYARIR